TSLPLGSRGRSPLDATSTCGCFCGQIIKGTNPDDIPVEQSTKFATIINLRTAKALGLEVPPTLLARAQAVAARQLEMTIATASSMSPARLNGHHVCHGRRAPIRARARRARDRARRRRPGAARMDERGGPPTALRPPFPPPRVCNVSWLSLVPLPRDIRCEKCQILLA